MHDSKTVAFVVEVFSFEHATVLPCVLALAISHAIEIHALINVAVLEHHLTKTRTLTRVIPFTGVFANIESVFFLVKVRHLGMKMSVYKFEKVNV